MFKGLMCVHLEFKKVRRERESKKKKKKKERNKKFISGNTEFKNIIKC